MSPYLYHAHFIFFEKGAEMLGVTQAMVSKLESGDANISVKKLAEIAAKLGGSLYVTLNLIPQQNDNFE
ncbi:Helix-turn-helix protein [Fervidobacterium pennivorans DSM 9078]|uniref:Helix-turn-helix protein n=2 Tax=Fervidobacterium pennivorans TaxID=93466 RepID=H9UDK1_FERPD|nr:Helix-turn-helix protein [Fervidobacterium pennivorans DSM 9078]